MNVEFDMKLYKYIDFLAGLYLLENKTYQSMDNLKFIKCYNTPKDIYTENYIHVYLKRKQQ